MDGIMLNRLENTVLRMENAVSKFEKILGLSNVKKMEKTDEPCDIIREFDEYFNSLPGWIEISRQIGGDVEGISKKVEISFNELRKFIIMASRRKRPTDEELSGLIIPLAEKMQEVGRFNKEHLGSPFSNHLSAVEEIINGFSWISIQKTPAQFVQNSVDASTFYLNRILIQYKNIDPIHGEWAKKWKEIGNLMYCYVVKFHKTGLEWNRNNLVQTSFVTPPPPPLPADLLDKIPKYKESKSQRDALFDEINKGEEIMKTLKKVSQDMQTRKNPVLRENSKCLQVGEKIGKEDVKPVKKVYMQNDQQWNIEYVIGESDIVIDAENKRQTIYIYKCQDAVIKINGKANTITLDSCRKTSVVFDGLICQCEIINCQDSQIQTLGELPTVSIQKSDGCQVYLSKLAHGAQIVSSKSSGMNILAQLNDYDEEYIEMAVPEQFVTTIIGKKLKTSVSELV